MRIKKLHKPLGLHFHNFDIGISAYPAFIYEIAKITPFSANEVIGFYNIYQDSKLFNKKSNDHFKSLVEVVYAFDERMRDYIFKCGTIVKITDSFTHPIDPVQHVKCRCDIEGEWKKPPIGIMPRYIFISKRIRDIVEAMNRFIEVERDIPIEWVRELNDLLTEQKEKTKGDK